MDRVESGRSVHRDTNEFGCLSVGLADQEKADLVEFLKSLPRRRTNADAAAVRRESGTVLTARAPDWGDFPG